MTATSPVKPAAPRNLESNALEAVTVLALALPKRDAVWWACVCVRSGTTAKEPAPGGGALAALGAFFSGGSLVPENVKAVVPPPEEGTTQAAATAVILAAVSGDPEKVEDNYRSFVKLGFEVARSRQAWCRVPAGGAPPQAERRETWAFPRQG